MCSFVHLSFASQGFMWLIYVTPLFEGNPNMDGDAVRLVAPVAYEKLLIEELIEAGDEESIAIQAEMDKEGGKCNATTLSEWRRTHLHIRRSKS